MPLKLHRLPLKTFVEVKNKNRIKTVMRSAQVPALLKNLITEVTIDKSIPLDTVSRFISRATWKYSKGYETL